MSMSRAYHVIHRDPTSTTVFVVGSTCGEAIIPICVGYIMEYGGAELLPWVTIFGMFILLFLYVVIHISATLQSNAQRDHEKWQHEQLSMDDSSSHPLSTQNPLNPSESEASTHSSDTTDVEMVHLIKD